jgi:hypothetical protein
MMMTMISMGSACLSETWPPMHLLYIPYEHGKPWRNDDHDIGKLLICPPQLFDNTTTSRAIRAEKIKWASGMRILPCK